MADNTGLAKKLNLKPGMRARIEGKPAEVDLGDVEPATGEDPDAVIVFVRTLADTDTTCGPVVEAANQDGLAWIAYPKGGKLGTDLNRDILWKHMLEKGIEAVRQVSIDETWSALRFRPAR
jgi:hypothetical protein